MTPASPMTVALLPVDEALLAGLLAVAVAESDADEVTPPLGAGPGWNRERRAWFQDYHRRCRSGLDGPAGEATWAVVLDGGPVGAVRLQRSGDPTVLVTGVWLARSARSGGVGTAALRLVLREASRAGATAVHADTRAANAAAQGALRRAGFVLAEPDAGGRVQARTVLGRPAG